MPLGQFSMSFGDAFFRFVHQRQIGQFINDGDNPGLFLTVDEVTLLAQEGHLTDGSTGGLVIGKFHHEGGIHMLQPSGDKFKYAGEMEGYEYLVNEVATKKYMDRLSTINEQTKTNHTIQPKPFHVPDNIRIIDARRAGIEILLISWNGHFILNRAASETHLELLDSINNEE